MIVMMIMMLMAFADGDGDDDGTHVFERTVAVLGRQLCFCFNLYLTLASLSDAIISTQKICRLARVSLHPAVPGSLSIQPKR